MANANHIDALWQTYREILPADEQRLADIMEELEAFGRSGGLI